MPAPKGNRFWEARTSYGREKLFSTPEALWDAAVEYFVWVEENPLQEEKVFHAQGLITKATVNKMRAMTIDGLCLFLGIDDQTLSNYEAKAGYEAYFGVVKQIKSVIRTQKFTGAAADQLNPNIIARDLGLTDKRDLTSSDGSLTPKETEININLDPKEAANAYRELMQDDD